MPERTLRARLEAETSQFSSRMAAAQAQLERMDRAPVVAARSMGMLQGSMRSLAFEAIGMAGPLGRVGTSLGMLAFGTTGTLAALAAIGVALKLGQMAFGDWGRAAREEAEETAKLFEASAKRIAVAASSTPEAKARQTMVDVALAQARIATFQAEIDAKRARIGEIQFSAFTEHAKERTRLEGEISALLKKQEEQRAGQLALLEQGAVKLEAFEVQPDPLAMLSLRLKETLPGLDSAVRLLREMGLAQQLGAEALFKFGPPAFRIDPRAHQIGLGLPPEAFIQRAFADTGPAKVLGEAVEAERTRLNLIDHLKTVIAEEAATSERAIVAQQLLAQATGETARASEEAAARMISAIGAMAAAMIRGPSVGGFLGFAGGIASLIPGGQVIGAGLMAAGGIASAIAGRGERDNRPVPVYDAAAVARLLELERKLEALRARRPRQTSLIVYQARSPRDLLAILAREDALGGGEMVLSEGFPLEGEFLRP